MEDLYFKNHEAKINIWAGSIKPKNANGLFRN
nr:MAG TPA: hypothetical protein [Caudoviricetes sp.]